MPFGMCNASATFQRAITRALRNIVNREGSMIMPYIDDIVIATETVEDHMIRVREVFNCLREAGFKMRVAKCDFMKSEIKYLGRVVSAEGIKHGPKAVEKLRDWEKSFRVTSIDLVWAFCQIPVRKADRQKTALACELGLFEWRRMPFGMCNASATFQRAIIGALRNIVNREGSMIMAYIDDIVIATETVEDHMICLREVFNCLREAGFKMRVAKCDFIKSEIKYLGRVVSAEGIKHGPKAVEKLRDWEKSFRVTSIDLVWAFCQIPVRKADRQKTALACE